MPRRRPDSTDVTTPDRLRKSGNSPEKTDNWEALPPELAAEPPRVAFPARG